MYCNKIRLLRDNAIFHPYTSQNSTGSTATYRDTPMATELIILIHVLPKHTLLLLACSTNKQLVLASISKVVFWCI